MARRKKRIEKTILSQLKELKKEVTGRPLQIAYNMSDNIKQLCSVFGRCWLCGTSINLTSHHLQNKHYRKDKLGKITLCKRCHRNIEVMKLVNEILEKDNIELTPNRLKEISKTLKFLKK